MTRNSLNRTMRRVYVLLISVLVISLAAKFGDKIPGLKAFGLGDIVKDLYEYMKDMALVFVTVIAAYLASVFQRRSKFIESLEEEWRGIVRTKSTLFAFCEKSFPTADDYIMAFCRISETLDNMRIVYRNVGETDNLVGLYPYAPLHDMRRALQTLDPGKSQTITPEARKLARDAILQSFYALRENFLEELDLESPSHPLLISGGRRLKSSGATRGANARQERQRKRQDREASPRPDIDTMLKEQREREKS
jgi:hypothetical protein